MIFLSWVWFSFVLIKLQWTVQMNWDRQLGKRWKITETALTRWGSVTWSVKDWIDWNDWMKCLICKVTDGLVRHQKISSFHSYLTISEKIYPCNKCIPNGNLIHRWTTLVANWFLVLDLLSIFFTYRFHFLDPILL